MTEAGGLLVMPRPLEEVFEEFLRMAASIIPARRILLLLQDEEGSEPAVRAAWPAGQSADHRLLLSRTLLEAVLEGRESVLVTDALRSPLRAHESIVLSKVRSAMVAPLFDNEKVLGLIYADTDDPVLHYDQDQLRAFTMLANLIAVKITNTRLLGAAREGTDGTGDGDRGDDPAEPAAPRCPRLGTRSWRSRFLPRGRRGPLRRGPSGRRRFRVVVGDVSGKGMGAALLMSHAMAALRLLYEERVPPGVLIDRVHRQVLRWSDASDFLTLFLGRLDPAAGARLRQRGPQSPAPLRRGRYGLQLDPTGMPVGLMAGATFETRP